MFEVASTLCRIAGRERSRASLTSDWLEVSWQSADRGRNTDKVVPEHTMESDHEYLKKPSFIRCVDGPHRIDGQQTFEEAHAA